jgi:phosphatidylglycerophosphatase A
MWKTLAKPLATFFYVGYFPGAPGTMATLAGLALALMVKGHLLVYIAVTVLVTYVGFKVSSHMENLAGQKDPGCIVIDEVAGILLALFLLPTTAPVLWSAFFLFRAFDMFKIYPANKFEAMHGGTGIMMDDVVAGVYTNIVMQVAIHFAGIS